MIGKKLRLALVVAVALLAGGWAVPAGATQVPTAVTTVTTTIVAPITCAPNEDSCNIGYVVNGGNGYVAFQQTTGGIWVRASLVPGWNNAQSPPITCKYSTSCVYDYVGPGSFWRARQASQPNGPWVQLTRMSGA